MMAGQCRNSPFCACAGCALDRKGSYMHTLTVTHEAFEKPLVYIDGQLSSKMCACGCFDLVLLSSLNLKLCPDCKAEIDWPLTEGQIRTL